MLCIAVTPTSRTLAKADLLNAARQADLVELCLDHFTKDPDVGDLVAACPKPVIVSCRDRRQGGQYDGAESNRLNLLRQAVIAGPAYVELDPDAAKALPRFGETKRLIAFHSPDKPLKKIAATVERAVEELNADAVKFTWPTPHLAAAWPLIYSVSKNLAVPVVGQGVGAGGLTFSLLARMLGSPWIYAALEEGMQDVPGQPTVEALESVYQARSVGKQTRFVAFAGFDSDELRETLCREWNAAAAAAGAPQRALPLTVGPFDHAEEMLRTLKIRAALLGPGLSAEERIRWTQFAPPSSEAGAKSTPTAAIQTKTGWRGEAWSRAATVDAVAESAGGRLERRQVTLLGAGAGAEALGRSLIDRGANLAVADPNDDAAAALAQRLDARAVQWRAIYSTHTDVLVRAERGADSTGPIPLGDGPKAYNQAGLEPRLTVADAASVWTDADFLTAARRHACTVPPEGAAGRAAMRQLFDTIKATSSPRAA